MFIIKISLNIEAIIFVLLLIFTNQIKKYAIFLLFILVHEFAHIIVGLILGFKPKNIMLIPVGFKMELKQTKYKHAKSNNNIEFKKIAVDVAGPLINLFIMGISIVLNLNETITYSNLLIALFNLIPIYPLDGGRIIKSVLNIKLDNKKSFQIINKVSNFTIILLTALCSIFILYIKNITIIIVLIYLWYVVIRENKRYKIIKRVYDVIENN